MRPAVSVVVPCFNSVQTLEETVASVWAQRFRDFELVLVDDGSTDGTVELAERLQSAHPATRLLRQENAGQAAARNTGIAEARGRYVLPLDSDDLLAPSMLEATVAELEARADVAVVFTDRRDFGDVNRVWEGGTFELARLKHFNQLSYCALYRRSLWEAIGGYRVNASGLCDWDFWVAAALLGAKAHHLPSPLFEHRRRKGTQMWRLMDQYERLHATIVCNNLSAYDETEQAAAHRYLRTGESCTMFRLSKLLFTRAFEGGVA